MTKLKKPIKSARATFEKLTEIIKQKHWKTDKHPKEAIENHILESSKIEKALNQAITATYACSRVRRLGYIAHCTCKWPSTSAP